MKDALIEYIKKPIDEIENNLDYYFEKFGKGYFMTSLLQVKYLVSNWEIQDASKNYITLNDGEDNYFVIINVGRKTITIEQVNKSKSDCDITEEEREYKGNFMNKVLDFLFMGSEELGGSFGIATSLVLVGAVISILFIILSKLRGH